jgi:hypothetical protein
MPKLRDVLRRVSRAAALFTALIVLADCSAVPAENAAQPNAPSDYGVLISEALKKFKDIYSNHGFEISGLRWVHAATGWNWLACVRYDDHGHRRTYVFFIMNNAVVNSRYDIEIDGCAAQTYEPFDVMTGAIGAAARELQQPVY